eukprot:TRINITY_DN9051_c0_g1_i1.p1 TRINITY_DN9051_c0_g1~~TRINITY_DN9051_c0_g1_i1.p1  ORF type:complete len:442 (-),score=98.62 TRINITY_DN9051_c0_g1_i1:131-1456(-)
MALRRPVLCLTLVLCALAAEESVIAGPAEVASAARWRRLSAAPHKKLKKGKKDDKEKKEWKKELDRLQNDKITLSGQVKASEADIAAKATTIAELTDKILDRESKISQLNNQLASRSSKQAGADLDRESKRNAELTEQVSAQQKEIARMTSELAAANIKNEDLRARYDDPSLQVFLAAKATKVYHDPGIEGAANKTFKYVLPRVVSAIRKGSEVYTSMNTSVYEGLLTIVGPDGMLEPWLPAVSGFLVYGLICLPLGISITCLAEFVCRLKELLFACEIYHSCITGMAFGFLVWTSKDPLHELADHDANVFLLQQAGFALLLILYFVLLVLAVCVSDIGTPIQLGCRFAQMTLVGLFCLVYYHLVWTPAMLDEMPRVDAFGAAWSGSTSTEAATAVAAATRGVFLPYALAAVVFFTNIVLEKLIQQQASQEESQERDAKDA